MQAGWQNQRPGHETEEVQRTNIIGKNSSCTEGSEAAGITPAETKEAVRGAA